MIGESHARGWVTLDTAGILAQSSNVGAITIGQRLGGRRFDQWVRKFGFGEPTGVDLPGEERGLVLPYKKYSGSSMGNLPIGQGELVTPMQMATAYSAIANGGILRKPHIVEALDGKPTPLPPGKRVISAHTAHEVRTMLEGVLAPGGTASEVKIPGYQLAGKTGTANKIDPTTGEYSDREVRRLVRRHGARLEPAAARRRDGRRAAGRDLRRRGRGARVRQDRVVRAALPADPTVVGRGYPQRSMLLRDLLGDAGAGAAALPEVEVTSLAYDARAVQPGSLFFCVPGFTRDGHDFAPAGDRARSGRAGRAAAARARRPRGARRRRARGDGAGRGAPATATRPPRSSWSASPGTNGKTTTAFLLRALLEAAGRRTGLLGTVEQVVGGVAAPAVRTTPEAIDLQATFARMLDGGDTAPA